MTAVRAVAVGYQGFGNLGDEAILAGIEELLAGTGIVVSHVVSGPGPVAAFPAARRVPTRRMRPTPQAVRALRRAQLLLISGGGLLHDHWATVVPTYLAWVVLGRLLGLRVAWLGVGVGPLRRRWARMLAGRAVAWSHLVTVRDEASARLVAEIAPRAVVSTVPDPAVFNPLARDVPRAGVGFIVRRPAPRQAARSDFLADALGRAMAALQRDGTPVQLLTFDGASDAPFAARVSEAAAGAGGSLPEAVALPPDPSAAIAHLASLEALVSVRLHGLILGAVAGTPAVSIAYDPKVSAWADRLGLSDYCLPMDEVSADAILDRLEPIRSPDTVMRMRDRLSALRREGDTVRALLKALA
jgi:polysaccharide pyruvyl transferase CsaB